MRNLLQPPQGGQQIDPTAQYAIPAALGGELAAGGGSLMPLLSAIIASMSNPDPRVLQSVVSPSVKAGRAASKAVAKQFLANQVDPLASKNVLFYNSNLSNLPNMFKTGIQLSSVADNTPEGVSLSRVPDIRTMRKNGIIVIDPSKAPPTRPIAEDTFGKTTIRGGPLTDNFWDRVPNKNFEFEQRTQGERVPADAIKQIFVKVPPGYQEEYGGYVKSIRDQVPPEIPVTPLDQLKAVILRHILARGTGQD